MMLRRLLLILSALSLLVCVVLTAACVYGQWRAHWFGWTRTDSEANTWRAVDVVSGSSGVFLFRQHYDFQEPGKALVYAQDERRVQGASHEITAPVGNPFVQGRYASRSSFYNRIGFGYDRGPAVYQADYGPYNRRDDLAHVPYWSLIAAFLGAGLPSVRAVIARRRSSRRLAAGCCLLCGYDLRGTPGRCPECGKGVAA